MRLFHLILVCGSLTAYSQPGCPTVTYPTVSSAALNTSSALRLVLKQKDGSYTAFEISNAPPFTLLRTFSHFDTQLSPCVTQTTGLNSSPIAALAQLATGGVILATAGAAGGTDVAAFDAGMNLLSEAHYASLAVSMFADLNGDGILDAIGTMFVNHNPAITVALGTGGAGFQPPALVGVPSISIGEIVVADVNGDHKPDLIVSTPQLSGQISLFLGNGDGTFQAPKTLVDTQSNEPAFAIADLNGDGKPDLVFGDSDPFAIGNVGVALGVGDGTFLAPEVYSAGDSSSIAIGDVNSDGIPDIVTGGGTILLGDGTGKFPTRRDLVLEASGNLIVTDFNGDGIADIVVAQGNANVIGGDSISVLYGRGKSTFAAPVVSLVPVPGSTTLVTADINGDGIADLVMANAIGGIAALKGAGDGSFQQTFQLQLVTNQIPWGIATGDFNHDGKTDFAVVASGSTTSSIGEVDVFIGNGDGTFQQPTKITAPLGAFGLVSGDFNRDGKLDLAVLVTQLVVGATDSVEILTGSGDGTFLTGAMVPVGPTAFSIAAADFNGDGKLDLIVTDSGTSANKYRDGNITLLTGKGDGTFSTSVIPFAAGYGLPPLGLATGDFNGDGKLDLAVSLCGPNYNFGGVATFAGRGDGTFLPPVIYSASAFRVKSVDIDEDGIPDLILSPSEGQGGGHTLGYMLGNGDGTFQPEAFFSPNFDGFYGFSPHAIADFNGDGTLDIASLGGNGIVTFLTTVHPAPSVRLVSAASLAPGPVAPDSIVTAFGKNLGSSVAIQDSSGASYPATVFYSSPTQVNFAIPPGLAAGPATVTIGSQTGSTVLAPVAPTLFTFNQEGLAAAYVTRGSGTGATYEPVYQLQNGGFTPIPIDVSAAAGPVYLVLFGTGLRNAGRLNIQVEGLSLVAQYSGAQPAIPGLDQVNVLLPASLSGSGIVNLILTFGGLPANPVYVSIK